jgi:hypothetical protein
MNLKPGALQQRLALGSASAIALLLTVLATCGLQAGSTFSIESTRGYAGTSVTVPITLRGQTNVVALQADILFDQARLSPQGASPGNATADDSVLSSSSPAPGVQRLILYSLGSAPMIDGVVVALNFATMPAANQNALRLSLSNVLLVTASPVVVPSTNRNGAIVINPIYIATNRETGFILAARAGQTNIIQASTDLIEWSDIGRVVTESTALEFTDTNAPAFLRRFYRAIPEP